jgi:probable rRNA maturation factor
VDLQIALTDSASVVLPGIEDIQRWANAAVKQAKSAENDLQVTVRIVDETEITQLNKDYRHKDGPTNVLSFPFESPPGVPAEECESLLGDVVVCAAVVAQEAVAQHKPTEAHWAHMLVHGILHLLGYDHQTDDDAQKMEALEINVLGDLGYPNPY